MTSSMNKLDKKPARSAPAPAISAGRPAAAPARPRPLGPVTLDAIDLRILEALQRDGRMSNVDLAAQVHLSAPQCFRRVRALEERGVLRGYRADVAPLALGLGVTAYVSLNITAQAFARARDLQALSKFLTDKLMQLDGVADVRSMICLEEIKPPAGLPVD